jgi:hypothetical protein
MKLLMALLVILSIDIMLILGSISVSQINPGANTLLNYNQSMMSKYDPNQTYSLNESYGDYLPGDEGSVTGTGNIFTDTFKSAKSWFTTGRTAINVVGILFFGPALYLHAINVPMPVVFSIALLWFLTTLIIVVSWIFGRQ